MDEQDRTPNVNDPVDNSQPPGERPVADSIPIPSRLRDAVEQVKQRAKEATRQSDDIVREYEDRYHGPRRPNRLAVEEDEDPGEDVFTPRKQKRRSVPVKVDENERKWAALAHASTLLTALVALASGGLGVLLTMFVPLCIYFAFRKRSEFVAFHALQAFTIQLIGTIGFLTLLIVGTIVFVALLLLSILLIIVLVGIILVPVVALTYVLFLIASLALPFGMVIYSVIAAAETWSGKNYRYPYIARWVENQMHGGATPSF